MAFGADGTFVLNATCEFPCETSCELELRDVDSVANGEFTDRDVPIAPVQTEEGDGHWYEGTFELHDIDIELDPSS